MDSQIFFEGAFRIEFPSCLVSEFQPFRSPVDLVDIKIKKNDQELKVESINLIDLPPECCNDPLLIHWRARIEQETCRSSVDIRSINTWLQASVLPLIKKSFQGDSVEGSEIESIALYCRYPQLFSLGELCPFGVSVSYSELTELMGYSLKHVRYVAKMVASNPLALLIPCHRIVHKAVRATPKFKWGSHIKATLLEYERLIKQALSKAAV